MSIESGVPSVVETEKARKDALLEYRAQLFTDGVEMNATSPLWRLPTFIRQFRARKPYVEAYREATDNYLEAVYATPEADEALTKALDERTDEVLKRTDEVLTRRKQRMATYIVGMAPLSKSGIPPNFDELVEAMQPTSDISLES